MSFLIPAAIKGGLAIGTSLLGSKLTQAKPSAQEQQVLNTLGQTMQTGLGAGKNLIGMGTQGYQPVLNYWSSLLSGNRGQATSAMAPEIQRISQGYQQAGQTASALMPRGGARADVLGNMPFQQQRDVSSLLQQTRPQAAQQLGGVSGSLLSGGVNALMSSTSAGRDILNQQQMMRILEQQRGQALGSSLFDQLKDYGPQISDWIMKKLKGGGGNPQDYPWQGPVQPTPPFIGG